MPQCIAGSLLARRRGSILVTTLIITTVICFALIGILTLSQYHYRHQGGRIASFDAFYTAENIMLEGVQIVADQKNPSGTYSMARESLSLPYEVPSDVTAATLTIKQQPSSANIYEVTGAATVRGKSRAILAVVQRDPPSRVFDYEYFLNNWGWWWGAALTGNGAPRTNWDFDFRDRPTLNGHIYANGNIESNLNPIDPFSGTPPFKGIAATDVPTYVHIGAPRVQMPNLLDFEHYKSVATGKLRTGNGVEVNKVLPVQNGKNGIYLEGTDAKPLVFDGSVVVEGDVIIKGTVTGMGTLYVGGNLYVAGNLKYLNGPNFNTPPATMETTARDAWVENAMNQKKDLVAFAVRESVLIGEVNGSTWKSRCYDAASYGLKNVGAEATLGADGIKGTPDDGIKYLDTSGDGTPDTAWYDADDDGVVDTNYNYTNQVQMTATRIGKIKDYPVTGSSKTPIDYNTVATDQITLLQGVFYTNHAVAMHTATGPFRLNGTVISRDEALIFSNSLNFTYDSRIHSRYQSSVWGGDANKIIDLGLPIAERVRILRRTEVAESEIDH